MWRVCGECAGGGSDAAARGLRAGTGGGGESAGGGGRWWQLLTARSLGEVVTQAATGCSSEGGGHSGMCAPAARVVGEGGEFTQAMLDERRSATWVEARAEVTLPSARAVHTEPIRESSERRSTARLSSCCLIAARKCTCRFLQSFSANPRSEVQTNTHRCKTHRL